MITRWDIQDLFHEDNYEEQELYHHGVLGMRWGHRKQQPTSSTRSSSDAAAKAARRKKIAKRVAIGVGAAAAIGGGLYLAKKKGLIGGKTGAQAMREVSRPSGAEMYNRYRMGSNSWHTISTPKLNPLTHKLSVSNKPITPDGKQWWQSKNSVRINAIRSGSGPVNRLVSKNTNIKVSKIAGRQTPLLNGGSGPMSKFKIPGAFQTPFSRNPKSVSVAGRVNRVGPFGVKTNSFVLYPGGGKDYLNTTTEAVRNWSKPGGWSKYKF